MLDNTNGIPATKTRNFFHRLCKGFFFLGSPNYWFEKYNFPPFITRILNANFVFISVIVYFFIAMELGAIYTQNDLNEKQRSDLLMFCLSQPILFSNTIILAFKRMEVRKIIRNLVVNFKKVHNDLEIERKMIKRATLHNTIFASFCISAVVFYSLNAIILISSCPGATFTTTITAWPDVKDQRALADVARTVFYFCWWFFVARISAMYLMIISTTIGMSHQFMNLCSYFESLNEIFNTNDRQEVKERKYEEQIKIGIRLHGETLQCIRLQQYVCNAVIGGQITINLAVMVQVLSQMVNMERSAANTLAIMFTGCSVLLAASGGLMWNAGDITVEASRLPTAMFLSGWHHCRGDASIRVRNLLTIAMTIGQKPVTLKAFGILDISYDSYVTIAKSSYSLFSVLY